MLPTPQSAASATYAGCLFRRASQIGKPQRFYRTGYEPEHTPRPRTRGLIDRSRAEPGDPSVYRFRRRQAWCATPNDIFHSFFGISSAAPPACLAPALLTRVKRRFFLSLTVLPVTCVTDIERKPFPFFPDAAMRNPINQAIRNMTFGAGIVSLLVLTVFILL
jgi:hypothetical protein